MQATLAQVRKLEMKLGQARDLLATETGLRKKAEQDRDGLSFKWEMVRELIRWGALGTHLACTWHLETFLALSTPEHLAPEHLASKHLAPEHLHLAHLAPEYLVTWLTSPVSILAPLQPTRG